MSSLAALRAESIGATSRSTQLRDARPNPIKRTGRRPALSSKNGRSLEELAWVMGKSSSDAKLLLSYFVVRGTVTCDDGLYQLKDRNVLRSLSLW